MQERKYMAMYSGVCGGGGCDNAPHQDGGYAVRAGGGGVAGEIACRGYDGLRRGSPPGGCGGVLRPALDCVSGVSAIR